MKYLIGLDCGATKTECAVADVKGNILHITKGNQANLLVTGINKAADNILSLLNGCVQEYGIPYSDIEKIVIGAAGAGRKEDAEKLKQSLIGSAILQGITFKSLMVVSDAQIALKGAFPNTPGCILIAGTGSIIYGKDESDNFYRAGGFGRILGDEGSGYSIGKRALQEAAKFFDGRKEQSLIIDLLSEKHSINTSDDLITKVYGENFDIASIAELVLIAAADGDKIALEILDKESEELTGLIRTMMNKMKVNELSVSFSGSLIANKNVYSDMLRDKIKTSLPSVKIIKAEYSPVEGAILMAKEMLSD